MFIPSFSSRSRGVNRLGQVHTIVAGRWTAWFHKVHTQVLWLTAYGIKSVGPCWMSHSLVGDAALCHLTVSWSCVYTSKGISCIPCALLVHLLFYFNPVILLLFTLFNSYILLHSGHTSRFIHFPSAFQNYALLISASSKTLASVLKSHRSQPVKTVVFNVEIWGQMKCFFKNFVDHCTLLFQKIETFYTPTGVLVF